MATEETKYLTFDEAVWFHFQLMWKWEEVRFGIESADLIDSAIARPKQAATYEDADIIRQASTLCFGLIKNHPWKGGNKRTATFLMRIFLKSNGFDLIYKVEDMIEMVLKVEADEWKVDEIENWLRVRDKNIGEIK